MNRVILCEGKQMQLKAHLNVVWAIQSPDKAVDFIDEQIRMVDWSKYKIIRKCFGMLEEI